MLLDYTEHEVISWPKFIYVLLFLELYKIRLYWNTSNVELENILQ